MSTPKWKRWEYELRTLLVANGYSVTRGAGSKGDLLGEKVDLIVSKETRGTVYTATIFGVQCKSRSK